jgi:hypothetical protein
MDATCDALGVSDPGSAKFGVFVTLKTMAMRMIRSGRRTVRILMRRLAPRRRDADEGSAWTTRWRRGAVSAASGSWGFIF